MGMIPISRTGLYHQFLTWPIFENSLFRLAIKSEWLNTTCNHALYALTDVFSQVVHLSLDLFSWDNLFQLVLNRVWTQFFWKIIWLQFSLYYSISRWCPPFCYTISSPNCNGVSSRIMNNSLGTSLHSTYRVSHVIFWPHLLNIDDSGLEYPVWRTWSCPTVPSSTPSPGTRSANVYTTSSARQLHHNCWRGSLWLEVIVDLPQLTLPSWAR